MGQKLLHRVTHRVWLRTVFVLLVSMVAYTSVPVLAQFESSNVIEIGLNDLSVPENLIYVTDNWRFKSGDDLRYANPDHSDSTWQQISTYLGPSDLPFIDWTGIGWFRLHIRPDSTLAGKPLALLIEQHNGASEIFLNGELIHRLGTVSTNPEVFEAFHDKRPRVIIFPDTTEQILAVRYANPGSELFTNAGYTAGFRFLFGEPEFHIQQALQNRGTGFQLQILFVGLLIAFTIIHLFLFIFYPDERRNLYFALFTALLALLMESILSIDLTTSPVSAIRFYQISLVFWILSTVFALLFSYSLFYKKIPGSFWAFLIAATTISVGSWIDAQQFSFFRELFVMLSTLEILRVLIFSFIRKKEGVWLIGSGLILFTGGIFFTVLANLQMVSADPLLGNLFGGTGLILVMSIYLSRQFSSINIRLKDKLAEVNRLSDQALKQERISKQRELERKLLEAENERKSSELEEARMLQLSMLPEDLPEHPHWWCSVHMSTAQEVGGDYYDYGYDAKDQLTLALGDATGHGMKSGIVVATAKSYFHSFVNNPDLVGIIRSMSSGIRNMNLRMMYMSMAFLRLNGYKVQYASAGIPPVLHFNHSDKTVRDVLVKGMPLGGNPSFPYEQLSIRAQPGDVLLMMSDGLMELFNEKREMLGLDPIRKVLMNNADRSTDEIITALTDLASSWAGEGVQQDDITLLVLKARNLDPEKNS